MTSTTSTCPCHCEVCRPATTRLQGIICLAPFCRGYDPDVHQALHCAATTLAGAAALQPRHTAATHCLCRGMPCAQKLAVRRSQADHELPQLPHMPSASRSARRRCHRGVCLWTAYLRYCHLITADSIINDGKDVIALIIAGGPGTVGQGVRL